MNTRPPTDLSVAAAPGAPAHGEVQRRGLGFLLADVTRMMRKAFERRAAASGLTLATARALVRIEQQQGLRQVELAELLEIQPITLGRIIDQLQEHGLVERRADARDRRAYRLHLTLAAGPILDEIHAIGDETSRIALGGMSEPDAAAITDALRRIQANLTP